MKAGSRDPAFNNRRKGTISPEMEQESSSPVVFFDDTRKYLVLTIEADKEAEELSDEETLIKDEG